MLTKLFIESDARFQVLLAIGDALIWAVSACEHLLFPRPNAGQLRGSDGYSLSQ